MSRPVALVTGAARGIGAAVVRRLVARGVAVTAVDSCAGNAGGTAYPLATRADLESVVAEAPDLVTGVVADVRDPVALRTAVAGAGDRLDLVVAAAAVLAGGRALWETPVEEVELLWQVDVLGVLHTAAATMPLLLERPASDRPTFVAVTSMADHRGLWHLGAYGMAKHAAAGLVRGLAADLAGLPVTVCGVAPDATDTAMLRATADLYGLDSVDELARDLPGARPLRADDVAAVVVSLWLGAPAHHGEIVRVPGVVAA